MKRFFVILVLFFLVVAGYFGASKVLGNELMTNVIFVGNYKIVSNTEFADNSTKEQSLDKFNTPSVGGLVLSPIPKMNVENQLALMENIKTYNFDNVVVLFDDKKNYEDVLPDILQFYPKDKVISFSATADNSLSRLKRILPKNTLVITTTSLSPDIKDETLRRFHDQFSLSVLKTLDKTGLVRADLTEKHSLRLFFDVLSDDFAGNVSNYLVFDDNSGAIIKYEKGSIKPKRNITIMAFGDVMLSRYVRTLMNRHGMDYVFEKLDKSYFTGSDFVFANLEGPINGLGTSGGTSMVFSFNKDIAPFLKRFGFNILSLANNHALDQGYDGRRQTIEALEAEGMGWCGHPIEADAESVFYKDIDGAKVAFVCFQDITHKLDDNSAIELIQEVRKNVDYLIVSVHWGNEYKHTPDFEKQVKPGHAFVDAGADVVIGHHPHVVQSFEIYNGKPIFYSLGNFVFDQYWSTKTQQELAIGIVLSKDDSSDFSSKIYLFPLKSTVSQSSRMSPAEQTRWIEEFLSYGNYDENLVAQIRRGYLKIGKKQ